MDSECERKRQEKTEYSNRVMEFLASITLQEVEQTAKVKTEIKAKRAYRKREKPTPEAVEQELLRANSRKAALVKLDEIKKKIAAGKASPDVTIMYNNEIFIISDRTDIFKIRDEKIAQLELALKRLKAFE